MSPVAQTGDTQVKSCADMVVLTSVDEAMRSAQTDASTSGARVFNCTVYQQGGRTHISFSVSFDLLVELAKFNSAHKKDNRGDADQYTNRPLDDSHVKDIVQYLRDTDNYILPPFTFNARTPIRVYAFGSGTVKMGYAVVPTDAELYITDGQHRIKALPTAFDYRPELRKDGAMVQIVQEDDLDKIHQDFVDCSRSKPIAPSLLTAFDVENTHARFTRRLAATSVIFNGRIDMIARTLGKDPVFLFTMNQLRVCAAEFLYGSTRKEVIQSNAVRLLGDKDSDNEKAMVATAAEFYKYFAENNKAWELLLQPAKETKKKIDLYSLRQSRIDFNTTGFQIISRVGHYIIFRNKFTDEQRSLLIMTLAGLDYSRNYTLWQGNAVANGKLLTQITAINEAVKAAVEEIKQQTGITLIAPAAAL